MALLCLFLLVPAPREPAPTYPVGTYSCSWGSLAQGMTFYPDGRYDSPEFGSGFWSAGADGWIWFSERDNTTHYVMWVDGITGTGSGWHHNLDNGSYTGEIAVRLIRRECLPAPRETK